MAAIRPLSGIPSEAAPAARWPAFPNDQQYRRHAARKFRLFDWRYAQKFSE